MTNNPTIDGVCKTCLGSGIEYDGAGHTCTACNGLGGSPAVERQPLSFDPDAISAGSGGVTKVERLQATCDGLDSQNDALATEIAALQSTIARLEARITQLESEKEFAAATYQAARDRIAELESGRGEPVAYGCFGLEVNGESCDFVTIESPAAQAEKSEKIMKDGRGLLLVANTPLFTSPPAPVAVVLPERSNATTTANASAHQAYALGWNACLDATAALNGPKP